MSEGRSISSYREEILNGPVVWTFFKLGIPPLLTQLIQVAYNVLDALWLSMYSDLAVAVPRQVWPVIFLFNAPMMALNAVGMSVISQYIGMGRYGDASASASRLLTSSLSLGILFSATLLSMRAHIFSLAVSTPDEIYGWVMDYSAVISLNILVQYVAFSYQIVLQAIGDTKRPAVINAVAVSVNTILDPLLILGIPPFPRTGVLGAALTDLLGSLIALVALNRLVSRYQGLEMRLTRNFSMDWVKLSVKIGLPILSMGIMNSLAFIAQLRLVNALGVVVVAAYSIGFVVADIVDAALFGLTGASSIMIGQSLGANRNERAKEISIKASAIVFSLISLGAILVFPFKASLADAFTEDGGILSEADRFLTYLIPTLPFFGLFMVGMSAGRGSGRTIVPTLIGIVRLWIVRIGLGYLLAFILELGASGIWFSISLSNFLAGAVAFLWLAYGRWNVPVVKGES
ncbi:MAG: MATE family efflux transporter [Candidatus Korarchaeum sp.]